MAILIADSGATKCEWCLLYNQERKCITTAGISPYFLKQPDILQLLNDELKPELNNGTVSQIYFYGTGLGNPNNVIIIQNALEEAFPGASVSANTDLLGAARALCGSNEGIACILGTGSNSCYYDGNIIKKNTPALGYVLGDEGSGAYLGKKVLQYYLYNTFDDDLMLAFTTKFETSRVEILEKVYISPLPNRYMAAFATFLSENRGHYMVENIIEDCFNDFFFHHLFKYSETWQMPVNFIGSIAYNFQDVLQELCSINEIAIGQIMQTPMDGLITYHSLNALSK